LFELWGTMNTEKRTFDFAMWILSAVILAAVLTS